MAGEYANYQNTLIDSFFHEQDQKLLKAFRERIEKLDRRRSWRRCPAFTTRPCWTA